MGRDVPVNRAPAWAVLALGLCLSGGCFKGPKPLRTAAGVSNEGALVALDGKAHRKVSIANRATERLPDGRLRVRVELLNGAKKDLPIQVQTIFRDGSGMLVKDSSASEMIVLPGSGSRLYEITSLRPDVESFLVQVETP